jgi:2-polyprenyl-6-methoxyphenol hydroxylase-like FAD-dependent oxidoreductase
MAPSLCQAKMSSTPKIAIIGAGPAGLMLARLLIQKSIPVTIFEREQCATFRSQGGTLDLHRKSGLYALKEAGLFDQFLEHARYEGDDLVMADKTAVPVLDFRDEGYMGGECRPEIDREVLRKMLLGSIPADCIQWDHCLITAHPDGCLEFQSGNIQGPFDLVVGADGGRSRIRPLLTDVTPLYSGIAGFEFKIADIENRFPHIAQFVGRGSYFCWSDGRAIQAQRLGDKGMRVYAWGKKPETWAIDLHARYPSTQELKKIFLREYPDWSPILREWIEVADEDRRPWTLYMLPTDFQWPHRRGFTLIGDAAHLMTPFSGEGVNAAFLDAVELSKQIVSSLPLRGKSFSRVKLDAAVAAYETALFPRAHATMEDTADNLRLFFRADAPLGFVGKCKQVMQMREQTQQVLSNEGRKPQPRSHEREIQQSEINGH